VHGVHLSTSGEHLAGGIRQVLDNRFFTLGERLGMLALHFRSTTLDQDVETVRRLIKSTPIDKRGPLIVRIIADTPEGVRRVTLDSRKSYAVADPAAGLFDQIGWVHAR
jgi:hypothetical protein